MSIRETIRSLSMFLIARYPFLNAVTLLMLLAERSAREEYPPMYPRLIYAHLGVFLLCGVCMGFNYGRKEAAIVHAGQLICLALTLYNNDALKYRQWVKVRMVHRMIGIAGFTLFYAYFSMGRRKSPQLLRIGQILVGIYLICAMYISVESPEDRESFVKLVPGGLYALYVYALIVGLCSLCYLPGFYVHDVSQGLVIVLSLSTIFIDSRLDYWTKKRGLDYWNQIRILSDNVTIIIGLLMYLTCTRKPVYGEPQQEKLD